MLNFEFSVNRYLFAGIVTEVGRVTCVFDLISVVQGRDRDSDICLLEQRTHRNKVKIVRLSLSERFFLESCHVAIPTTVHIGLNIISLCHFVLRAGNNFIITFVIFCITCLRWPLQTVPKRKESYKTDWHCYRVTPFIERWLIADIRVQSYIPLNVLRGDKYLWWFPRL